MAQRLAMVGSCLFVVAMTTMFAQAGAKSLFLDPTSGVSVEAAPARRMAGPAAPERRTASAAVRNVGLMYYVERQRPDGRSERVSPTTVFHSGDRIRLLLTSNANGRLVIAQRGADGRAVVLFPDRRIAAGDNRVRAGQPTPLPSVDAWFKFDDHPGEERLIVTLTRESAVSGAPGPDTRRQETALNAEDAVRAAQAQKGSKSLVVEVDPVPERAAAYVVKPIATDADSTLATEIVLVHE